MANLAGVRSGSGRHTLSTLCFKPYMESESELGLDSVLDQTGTKTMFGCVLEAQPKAMSLLPLVDMGPDCNLCFSALTPIHLHCQFWVVFDESAGSAPWAIAGT